MPLMKANHQNNEKVTNFTSMKRKNSILRTVIPNYSDSTVVEKDTGKMCQDSVECISFQQDCIGNKYGKTMKIFNIIKKLNFCNMKIKDDFEMIATISELLGTTEHQQKTKADI